jgi:Dyp-type peroxidase family
VATTDVNGGLERDDIQGLLASGYGHLREASFLLLAIDDPTDAGAWLGRLADELTTARAKSLGTAVNVALAPSGLAKLGLAPTLGGFSDRFLDGMTPLHRSRALGDVGDDAPERWDWGGRKTPVDLLLLLYAEDKGSLSKLEQRLMGAGNGLKPVRRLDTHWSEREHFGFRDGIAQPVVEGLREAPPDDTIKAGEFVLGYPNEHGQLTDRPLVSRSADSGGVLPADPVSGDADLGRNGSYLVLRQLSQDVPAFWSFVDRATSGADGRSDPEARVRLAAQIVGRWPEGEPLVLAPGGPNNAPYPVNEFRYHGLDPDGLRCPLGAHIRRSHPRDMLDPDPGSERSIALDKHHRLMRRGRTYGSPIAPDAALNGGGDGERGLHFICLCANIARQFEFVQHTWLNNPKFNGLYDDADPLVGPAGRSLTVQAQPVRQRVTELPSFVGVRGGGYFFLPGVQAVRYLANLPASVAPA